MSREKKPTGLCTIYELRPAECRIYECDASLKTVGAKCASGCVKCCLGQNVVQDETSGLYYIERGSKGPCTKLTFHEKPQWVGAAEAERDTPEQTADPMEEVLRREERQRLRKAISVLPKDDAKLITAVFALEGGAPKTLEAACRRMKIPIEEGRRRYEGAMASLKKSID